MSALQFQDAGLIGVYDVDELDANVNAQVQGLDGVIAACSGMTPTDLSAWAAYRDGWNELHRRWLDNRASWWNVPGLIGDQIMASTMYDNMNGYAAKLPGWQADVHAHCAGYVPPPGVPVPTPPAQPSEIPTTDWGKVAMWGGGTLLAIFVLSKTGLPRIWGKK